MLAILGAGLVTHNNPCMTALQCAGIVERNIMNAAFIKLGSQTGVDSEPTT